MNDLNLTFFLFYKKKRNLFKFGTWRRLVARLFWEQKVMGSTPIVPYSW